MEEKTNLSLFKYFFESFVDETLKIIEDILDYNKGAKIFFRLHQKLIKENQNQHLKKVLQIGYN